MEQKTDQATAGVDSRRDFIKKAATAAAAVATANVLKTPVYGQNQAPSTGRVIGANDRISVGYIGIGGAPSNSPGMGMAHVKSQKKNASENNIVQAAVCDLYTKRNELAKQAIGTSDVVAYDDYRKLIERKDIDAVVVATVDHWHTRCSIDAMETGKHIYCEKPMTRYLGEAFEIYDAVKRTGRTFQVGSQGCSALGWHKAAELIKGGKIGKMVWGQGFYCRNNPKGEWNYSIDPGATPDTVNWQSWLGPVNKKIPFIPDHFFRWRKYYPYCGGLLGDLVPHRLLPLMLASGSPEFPKRVVSIGTRSVHTDKNTPGTYERDVPEHVKILVEFPSGLILTIVSSTVNAKSPGFVIYGHKATVQMGNLGESLELTPEKDFTDELDPISMKGLSPTEDVGVHEKNWFDSIRNGKQPNANIELAVRAQTVISLAEMSERLQIACLFDEKTRKVMMGTGQPVEPLSYKTIDPIKYGSFPLS